MPTGGISTVSSKLVNKFDDAVKEFQMVLGGDRVIVAVSGGPDSMALLHLFATRTKLPVGVFHLNHEFRECAQDEAEFVEKMAKKWQMKSHIYRYNVIDYLERTGESKQSGARNVRYSLLEQCVAEHGYTKVALAHHSDDQAETVLMRILRGAGLRGLSGIHPVRGYYIRPLLFATKSDILSYCLENDIPYCQDQSNFTDVYQRNKIRLHLLPYLEREYNPEVAKQLCTMAETARADEEELHNQTEKLVARHTWQNEHQLFLDRHGYLRLSLALQRRVLRLCLSRHRKSEFGLNFHHVETLRDMIDRNTSFMLTLPQVMVNGTTKVIIFGQAKQVIWEEQVLNVPGRTRVGEYTIDAQILAVNDQQPTATYIEDFALEDLSFPLYIRPRSAGDRIQVFGQNRMKKVKDLLIDAKIPQYMRDNLPLVCDNKSVLWVCGVRRSEKGRVGAHTTHVLRLVLTHVKHCHGSYPVL